MQRRVFSALIASSGLMACGFKMRGEAAFKLPFQTMHTNFAKQSALGAAFQKAGRSRGVVFVVDPAEVAKAQVHLRVLQDQTEKVVVGSLATGQVREFQLRVRFKFIALTPAGRILIDETELLQQRDFSYSESAAVAKEAEEQSLYKEMQAEVAQQLMHRLSVVSLP